MNQLRRRPILAHLMSGFVFLLLALYTYGRFFVAPYVGFYFNPSNAEVVDIFVDTDPKQGIQMGDVLLQVGSVPWSEYETNKRQALFMGYQPGENVPLRIQRAGRK
jgi:hypothetical protein